MPQNHNLPAGPLESRDGVAVPLLVAIEFSIPEGGVRSGPLSTRTVMAVPEATMDEDGDPVARQDNVGRSREISPMQPEAKAFGVQETAGRDLGFCVFGPDGCHKAAARF